jgi:hypothetical protein
MAAALALVAAFLFAVAAALQQKGALNLPTISLQNPSSLLRLAGQTTWLVGTLALLIGYLFQAGALDRGRLAIIQPLLVTTVVFVDGSEEEGLGLKKQISRLAPLGRTQRPVRTLPIPVHS